MKNKNIKPLDALKHYSLLYIEDDPTTAKEFLNAFGDYFKVVYGAKDATEGLRLFHTKMPDIIVTELQLSQMDGLEMIALIQKERPTIPIIVNSTFSDTNLLLEIFSLRIDNYVRKPTNPQTMILVLEKVAKMVLVEKELQDANHTVQVIIDEIPDPILYISPDFEVLLMNSSAKKFGLDSSHPQGEKVKCYEISHHSSVVCSGDIHPCPIEYVKKTKKPTTLRHIHTTKEGEKRQVDVHLRPIFDENNEIKAYLEVSHDITEYINIQQQLLYDKVEFETIFNYSKDGIAILDLESNFLNFNDSYLDMTGYSRKELLQKSCIELTAPEDKERSTIALEFVLKQGHLENYEKTCIVNHGKMIVTNMSISLLPDRKRILLVTKDVSKLKLLESQTKLASMGEMIGNIAHQWRQPLSVISSLASGVAFKKEYGVLKEDEIIDFMNQIVNQVNYLSQTIDDFRNFIKGGDSEEGLNLGKVFEKTLSIVGSSLKSNYIEIVSDIDTTLEMKGYENELIQAFINIINNAKDALLGIDGIENKYIFIDIKRVKHQCEITIKDNGGGINVAVLEHIFEPYFTTKHQSKGTGLGLAMSYKIITQIHTGSITASNTTFEYKGKKYKGAKFTILFDFTKGSQY